MRKHKKAKRKYVFFLIVFVIAAVLLLIVGYKTKETAVSIVQDDVAGDGRLEYVFENEKLRVAFSTGPFGFCDVYNEPQGIFKSIEIKSISQKVPVGPWLKNNFCGSNATGYTATGIYNLTKDPVSKSAAITWFGVAKKTGKKHFYRYTLNPEVDYLIGSHDFGDDPSSSENFLEFMFPEKVNSSYRKFANWNSSDEKPIYLLIGASNYTIAVFPLPNRVNYWEVEEFKEPLYTRTIDKDMNYVYKLIYSDRHKQPTNWIFIFTSNTLPKTNEYINQTFGLDLSV